MEKESLASHWEEYLGIISTNWRKVLKVKGTTLSKQLYF